MVVLPLMMQKMVEVQFDLDPRLPRRHSHTVRFDLRLKCTVSPQTYGHWSRLSEPTGRPLWGTNSYPRRKGEGRCRFFDSGPLPARLNRLA
jgi:hypothetical protein